MASTDNLTVEIEGVGGHAARPHIAIDPILVGAQMVSALQSIVSRNVDPLEFMTDLLGKAESQKFEPGSEQALREVLDMMACKAAVKAGDKLAPEELAELLRYRDTIERASNCPHGRPTTLRLTIKELEKQFGRT